MPPEDDPFEREPTQEEWEHWQEQQAHAGDVEERDDAPPLLDELFGRCVEETRRADRGEEEAT